MDDFYGNNGNGYNNGGYNNNGYGGGYNNGGYNNNGYGSNGYNNNGYGSNGYNNGGYNNGYNNGQNFGYNSDYEPDTRGGAGLAIASFVISLVNLLLCCTLLSIITVPLCLIFSIISLVKKRKGTVLAIFGIILSLLAGTAFVVYGKTAYDFGSDIIYFAENEDQIIEDYERDGTIPDRFEKYRSSKYDKTWKDNGFKDFDDFFGQFIEERKRENSSSGSYSYSGSSNDLALGFQPALLV